MKVEKQVTRAASHQSWLQQSSSSSPGSQQTDGLGQEGKRIVQVVCDDEVGG